MNKRKINFRSINNNDNEYIANAISELALNTNPKIKPLTTKKTVEIYGPSGLGHFDGIVAEQEGVLIGLCLYSIKFSGWRGTSGIFVSDLYIKKNIRSTGCGRDLLKEVAKKGIKEKCNFLQLDVDTNNENAIGFYSHLGMSINQNDMHMYMEKKELMNLARM